MSTNRIHIDEYQSTATCLAISTFALLVGAIAANTIYGPHQWIFAQATMNLIVSFLAGLLGAIALVYYVFRGHFPESPMEWIWTGSVAIGFGAIVYSLFLPSFLYFMIHVFILFALSALLVVIGGESAKSRWVIGSVASLVLAAFYGMKLYVLVSIEKDGEFCALGEWKDGPWLLSHVYNLFREMLPGSIALSAFGMNTANYSIWLTAVIQLIGFATIIASAAYGFRIMQKMRTCRANAYFDILAEHSGGLDLRYLFTKEQIRAYRTLPVEEHQEATIENLKMAHQRFIENRQALINLSCDEQTLTDLYGPAGSSLLEMKHQLRPNDRSQPTHR